MWTLFLVLLVVLVGCQSQATHHSDTIEKELKSKLVLILSQGDEEVVLKDEDAKKIYDLLDDIVYDGDQYDKDRNPEGYRLTLADSDYTLVEKKGEEVLQTIYMWKDIEHIKKENKWYFYTEVKNEIMAIVEKYV